jgi:DNA end-binding protein Ku
VQPTAEEDDGEVPDLMSALKASLDAVKAREDDGDAPASRKPVAKKAPAKKPAPKKAASKS